jgi:hypothetical protein
MTETSLQTQISSGPFNQIPLKFGTYLLTSHPKKSGELQQTKSLLRSM